MGQSTLFLLSIAILVLLKQTFFYIVPISLFAITCQRYAQYHETSWRSFISLWIQSSLLFILFLSIGIFPWLYDWQQLKILQSRLFPFDRGLLHAYWPPHFWAVYGCLDQLLSKLTKILFPHSWIASSRNISSRGLIGIMKPFLLLPNPSPWICHAMVVLGMLPSFYDLWKSRRMLLHPIHSMEVWMRALTIVFLSSFLFGWHVHEKAILMPQFCMIVLCWMNSDWLVGLGWISTVATSCMFPLIFGCLERIVIMVWIIYPMALLYSGMENRFRIFFFFHEICTLGWVIGLPWIVQRWLPHYAFLPWMMLSGYGGMITCGVFYKVIMSTFD
ncbi:hypothetical protein GpartN1_g5012.t1 [Galdieria partita]|nr:hypothetical protein GpartN1_g5012.t1 [Galdieria partita]